MESPPFLYDPHVMKGNQVLIQSFYNYVSDFFKKVKNIFLSARVWKFLWQHASMIYSG